jgi:hypothetical protein
VCVCVCVRVRVCQVHRHDPSCAAVSVYVCVFVPVSVMLCSAWLRPFSQREVEVEETQIDMKGILVQHLFSLQISSTYLPEKNTLLRNKNNKFTHCRGQNLTVQKTKTYPAALHLQLKPTH